MKPAHLLIACIVFAAPALGADEKVPWPEHPRPDFMREPWLNLNGKWKFAFDPDDVGIKEEWFKPGKHRFDREIVVPFAWESKLSGIGENYVGVGWYAREITLPDGERWKGKDAWLIVGACDFTAKVWVNGQDAGEFTSGYLPFEANLFAKPGEKAAIVIRAEDKTDLQQPLGKQHGWYTRTSGIWQTVYLEPRGKRFVREFQMRSDPKTGEVRVKMVLSGDPKGATVMVSDQRGAYNGAAYAFSGDPPTAEAIMRVDEFTPWTPDAPVLHPVFIGVSERISDREAVFQEVET